MANPGLPLYRLRCLGGEGMNASNLLVQFLQSAFTTTATNVNVSTDLSEVSFAFVAPTGAGGAINTTDLVFEVDTTVVSDVYSITRTAGSGLVSGRTFCVMALGRQFE